MLRTAETIPAGRLPEPLVEGGTRYVQFSRLKYGSNKSSADYAVGDAAKLGVTGDGYGSFTGDKANRTLLVKVKAFIIAEATLDAAQRAKEQCCAFPQRQAARCSAPAAAAPRTASPPALLYIRT